MNRPVLVCRAHTPLCPKCERPLHGIQLDTGSLFAVCGAKLPRSGSQRPRGDSHCGQRVHILGTGHGVCVVVGLTREEHQRFTRQPILVEKLYRDLNILATRESRGDLPAA